MAQNDVFSLTLVQQGPAFAQEIINVLHYRQTSVIGSDDGESLANAWLGSAANEWQDVVNVGVVLTSLRVRNITQPLFGVDFAVTPPLTGTRLGESFPATSAAVLSLRTGLIGRSRRGRMYLAPGSEADQNAGQISGGYATSLALFADAIKVVADVDGSSYALVVWSELLQVATPVTDILIDQILGTQVRRRPGRGA
jgi:hypothetical protein